MSESEQPFRGVFKLLYIVLSPTELNYWKFPAVLPDCDRLATPKVKFRMTNTLILTETQVYEVEGKLIQSGSCTAATVHLLSHKE